MKLVSLQALNSETPVAPFRLHEVNRAEVSLQRRSRDPYGSAVIHSVGSGSPVFLVPGGGAHGDGPWFGGRESGTSRNVLEKFSSPLQVFILGARRLRLPPSLRRWWRKRFLHTPGGSSLHRNQYRKVLVRFKESEIRFVFPPNFTLCYFLMISRV